MRNTNENFEFYFEELEKILRKLESQNISLDESIKLLSLETLPPSSSIKIG